MTLNAGTRIDHYRIVRRLGSGGMADVYEVDEADPPRRVALKVLPERHGSNPDTVDRFRREARAAASLNHRGIVQIFSVGHDKESGLHYYSMRLLGGGDLVSRIEHGITVGTGLRILRELAAAFGHAHERGLIHRDVKPANVLFDEQDHPVLTDFGIAKALHGSHLTVPGTAVGTPAYMSPEQATSKVLDGRSDLYGLGVILFEMLTGHLPFEADNQAAMIFKHLMEPVPRLPSVFAPLQGLVDTLMNKDPAGRPRDADTLIRLIDDWVEAHGAGRRDNHGTGDIEHPLLLRTYGKPGATRQIVEPPPTLLKATSPPTRKSGSRMRWLAAGAGVFGLLGFVVISTQSQAPIPPAEVAVTAPMSRGTPELDVPVAERGDPEKIHPASPGPEVPPSPESAPGSSNLPTPTSDRASVTVSKPPPVAARQSSNPVIRAPVPAAAADPEPVSVSVVPPTPVVPAIEDESVAPRAADAGGVSSRPNPPSEMSESADLLPIPLAAESRTPIEALDAGPEQTVPQRPATDPAGQPDREEPSDREKRAIRRARDMGTY